MKPRDLLNQRPATASEHAAQRDALRATHNAALAAERRAQHRAGASTTTNTTRGNA